MDAGFLVALVVGVGAVLTANLLEGGTLSSLLNLPAFVLVVLGTFGATAMSFRNADLRQLPRSLALLLRKEESGTEEMVEQLVRLSRVARQEGLLALEVELARIEHPFLQKALRLVVDGVDEELIRQILEVDIRRVEERQNGAPIFETAGGYAPTMGIIGTVMGLVHVLSSLSEPEKLGESIAVAFLATLYGVASANLLWLPMAARLKAKTQQEVRLAEMLLEGVLSIRRGENPTMIRERLAAFAEPGERREGRAQPAERERASAQERARA